jgi:hypothetical protein
MTLRGAEDGLLRSALLAFRKQVLGTAAHVVGPLDVAEEGKQLLPLFRAARADE